MNPGIWLNDEVINFYVEMLNERETKKSSATKNWYFSSFFFTKLMQNGVYNYNLVKTWAKANVFSMRSISFPINIIEFHWKWVYIFPFLKVIGFYDPLGPNNNDVENYGVHFLRVMCYIFITDVDFNGFIY